MEFRVISWVLNRNSWCILDDIANDRPLFGGMACCFPANGCKRTKAKGYAMVCHLSTAGVSQC